MTSATGPEAVPITQPGKRKRQLVLAVEDEYHDWLIYGKLLWYNGFDVLHAESAEDGLGLAREYLPDVILADLVLPQMSGIDLCRAVREDPRLRDIPVIMLTGRSEREYGSKAREAGCTTYLEKPTGPLDLLHTIEELVGRPPPPAE